MLGFVWNTQNRAAPGPSDICFVGPLHHLLWTAPFAQTYKTATGLRRYHCFLETIKRAMPAAVILPCARMNTLAIVTGWAICHMYPCLMAFSLPVLVNKICITLMHFTSPCCTWRNYIGSTTVECSLYCQRHLLLEGRYDL
jgi:hypothetical protein